MRVKLISITESCIAEKSLSPEELIVYVARVSNPGNQLNSETAHKLIAYLIKNKHWSPFEMVDMTVEIVTSRAIAQQILRHRSFSFQEFSQRYATANEVEPVELRWQAESNRQSSSQPVTGNDYSHFQERVMDVVVLAQEVYQEMLAAGVARECARMVLPLTTQTTLYMKGSVRSWIHYLQVRCDEHTQLEHRQVALKIKDIFAAHFPNIHQAMKVQ